MIKVGVLIRCYYLTDFLQYVINCFKDMYKVVIVNCKYKGLSEAKDFTRKIYENYNLDNLNLYEIKEELEEYEVINRSLYTYFDDCKIVFLVDGDEIIFEEDIEKIINILHHNVHDLVMPKVVDYADSNHIYKRDHHPIVAFNLSPQVMFYDGRCGRGFDRGKITDDIILHHLGFCFPKDKLEWKMNNYWNNGNKNQFKEILSSEKIPYQVPALIKNILDKVKNRDMI